MMYLENSFLFSSQFKKSGKIFQFLSSSLYAAFLPLVMKKSPIAPNLNPLPTILPYGRAHGKEQTKGHLMSWATK
jgi:hypothetical protein